MAFRDRYYSHLQKLAGLKVEPNLRSPLEYLLTNNDIDIISLKKLCLKSSIPPTYRPKVWKILLGIYPCYQETWNFVQEQNIQQYNEIERSGQVLLGSFKSPFTGTNEENKEEAEDMITKENSKNVENVVRLFNIMTYINMEASISPPREKKNITDIAKVFCNVFSDPVDAFFCHYKMVNLRIQNQKGIYQTEEKIIDGLIQRVNKLLTSGKQIELLKHLKNINLQVNEFCYSWFSNYFASCIPTNTLKKIWDKVIGIGDSILPYYGYSILNEMAPLLLNCVSSKSALNILMTIPDHVCAKIEHIHEVAIDLFEEYEDNSNLVSPKISRN